MSTPIRLRARAAGSSSSSTPGRTPQQAPPPSTPVYEDDSDVETERKDKIFRRIDQEPWNKYQKGVLLALFGFIAAVSLLMYWVTTKIAQSRSQLGQSQTSCVELGLDRSLLNTKFTFVILGYVNLDPENFRRTLRAMRPSVEAGDAIVIGLERILRYRAWRAVIEQELEPLKGIVPITMCESSGLHNSWRQLWKRKLVSEDFIILDEVGALKPGWRRWLEESRKAYPQNVLALQQGPSDPNQVRFVDNTKQILISTVPGFAATSPGSYVWGHFLNWFDSNPEEQGRFPGMRIEGDVEDHWIARGADNHNSWTCGFAQFLARYEIPTVYALPQLAHTNAEFSPKHKVIG